MCGSNWDPRDWTDRSLLNEPFMYSLEIFLEQIKLDEIKQTPTQLNWIETNGLFDTEA